jgi:DNA-binding transcriptional MerR regulator
VIERFHIGKLAKRCGRSVHTIRWYEAQGLIPGVDRDAGGRRVYVHEHVEHLVFLEWLRRTGMSVEEMRKFTSLGMQGWRTLEEREARLRAHRERMQNEIDVLHAALDLIDAKLAYYADWKARKKRPPPLLTLPVLKQRKTREPSADAAPRRRLRAAK